MEEDIEPTLRFKSCLSRAFVKRILDAVTNNSLVIEEVTVEQVLGISSSLGKGTTMAASAAAMSATSPIENGKEASLMTTTTTTNTMGDHIKEKSNEDVQATSPILGVEDVSVAFTTTLDSSTSTSTTTTTTTTTVAATSTVPATTVAVTKESSRLSNSKSSASLGDKFRNSFYGTFFSSSNSSNSLMGGHKDVPAPTR